MGLFVELLEDPENKLTIEDVTKSAVSQKFEKSKKKNHNFGLTHSAYWARFKINNQSGIKHWILSFNYALQDEIKFFRKKGMGKCDDWR